MPTPEISSDEKTLDQINPQALGESLEKAFAKEFVSAYSAAKVRRTILENARRKIEGLKLYEPLPVALAFHQSSTRVRLARGSNRAGKTLMAAVEVARACLGQSDKFPKVSGRCYCVGKNLGHIGEVMWRKLSRAGAFKIIRDKQSDLWRALRPWIPEDYLRIEEAKPAPPLIPPRMIKSIGWEAKSKGIPKMVILQNDWEISFFSSEGKPPQGADLDLCLAGWSEVYDPIARKMRRIDEITEPWHVYSFNKATGGIEIRRATVPFVKSFGELCRIRLSDGQEIFSTRSHRVLSSTGQWVSVEDAWKRDLLLQGVSAQVSTEILAAQTRAERTQEKCQEVLQSVLLANPHTATAARRLSESGVSLPRNERNCGIACALLGSETTQGCQDDCLPYFHPCDERLPAESNTCQVSVPSPGYARGRSLVHWRPGGLAEISKRSRSCPSSVAVYAAFYAARSVAWSRRLRGVLGKRLAGMNSSRPQSRQLSCSAWHTFRRSIEGQAVCGEALKPRSDYEERFGRPPTNEEWSDTTFGSGLSAMRRYAIQRRIIDEARRDRAMGETGNDAGDDICPRLYITSIAAVCQGPIWDIGIEETHNYIYGPMISHNCWLDEEIMDEEWYPEMRLRLLDRSGRLIWSATPQAATQQLFQLHERAVEEYSLKEKSVEEFVCLLMSNPHIDPKEKKDLLTDVAMTEDTYRVRIEGEFAFTSYKVYPEFNMQTHGCDWFEIPRNWTRYLVIDPGFQVCAVLFATVPPPSEGDFVYLYDELYLKDCNAATLADAVAHKTQVALFQAFIIDYFGSLRSELGIGKSVMQQYTEVFQKKGIRSASTGSGFIFGNSDISDGVMAVHNWLRIQENGKPKLQVLRGKLPNFEHEIKYYHKKKTKGDIIDKPDQRKANHLQDCLRYLAMYSPRYIKPKISGGPRSPVLAALDAKKKRKRELQGGNYIRLGPGRQ